ncbi:MAG: CoA transferase [Dehalococcoidia bacterium]|nr:CoA transferase [Dehalococcoidia bacterium]
MAIAVETDEQWRAFCRVANLEPLADSASFASASERAARQDELDALVEAWTRDRDRYEVMRTLQDAGVPAGAVQDGQDLAQQDPQLGATGFFGTAESEAWGTYGIDRFPALFAGRRPEQYDGVRGIGSDTFAILEAVLGMDEAAIAEAVADGAIA